MTKKHEVPNEAIHRAYTQEFGEPGPWSGLGRRIGTCLALAMAMFLILALIVAMVYYL